MQPSTTSFDPIWETIYSSGNQLNKYPYDQIVTFVFRFRPRTQPIERTQVLELGCGAGNNIAFLAREGFKASGIDASEAVIAVAKQRLNEQNLKAHLEVADFVSLPFENESFDMIIDRGSVTCCGFEDTKRVFSDCLRVLKPGGKFYFSPFSQQHTSYHQSEPGPDLLRQNISGGTLQSVGKICFYDLSMIEQLIDMNVWNILQFQHVEKSNPTLAKHAENASHWEIILEKKPC